MPDADDASASADFAQIVHQIDSLIQERRRPETNVDWAMGDFCNELTQISRDAAKRVRAAIRRRRPPDLHDQAAADLWRKEIPRIAHEVGVSRQHLMSLAQVTRTWPAGHWVRNSFLSFAHLKKLIPISDPALRDELARLAAEPPSQVKRNRNRTMTTKELSRLIAERAPKSEKE